MTPDSVTALFSQALFIVISMVSVIVLPSLVVGLIIAIFQAATQINEQTLSFLPRLLATLITLSIAAPWLGSQMTDFFNQLLQDIPYLIH